MQKELESMPIRWMLKVAFAANAMAFMLLLCLFLIVLFARGPESADRVWTDCPYYLIVWPISIVVCVKFLRR